MKINISVVSHFGDIWREYTNYRTSLLDEEIRNVTVENKDIVRVQTDVAFHKGNNIPFKLYIYKSQCQIDAIKTAVDLVCN